VDAERVRGERARSVLGSAPARAADLLRVPIDAELQHLLAGADGGA
jgi:hypothetical protein